MKKDRLGQASAFSLILLVIAILMIVGWLGSVAYIQLQQNAKMLREAQERVEASKEWVELRVMPNPEK